MPSRTLRAVAPRRRIVMVLGMHRSGTSLCANMLQELGVDMAEAQWTSAANARGHWERPRINDLHDEVLALFGRAWDAPTHHLALPDQWWTDPRVAPISETIAAFVEKAMSADRLFGFKDPRTARLLPMWPNLLDRLGAEPVYVFCVRDPAQVARSVTARDRLAGDQAAYRWLVYNAQAVAGVGRARVCVVRYEDWFVAPAAMITRLAQAVGLPARADLVSVVDEGLRHDALGAAEPVPALAADMFRQIGATGDRFDLKLTEQAATVLGCEHAVLPFLRDAALLPLSVAEQNRAIKDLHVLIEKLRAEVHAGKQAVRFERDPA